MNIISCTAELHAAPILDILNDAIATSTALYDYQPRGIETMGPWFAAKRAVGFPVVGVVGDGGRLLGFATYGPFRPFPAYKYTVEHSVYVHRDHRGRGVGTAAMKRLILLAAESQQHVMVGAIDAANTASIAFHERLGFAPCGIVRQAGYKFGRWLDLALYQLVLATPDEPVDG
ncbi:MAG: N-acetyltransferase family protein [Betaproteobacteria bacterium]|nr:N-acetyltransferase family protein [Betaproteobacteria bacterium]